MDINSISKFLATSILPQPVLYRLWHVYTRRKPRTKLDTAFDVRATTPQKGVKLEVYWSDVPNVGRGPSASLFVIEEEILRFDCFGGNAGHMHINPVQIRTDLSGFTARLYFPKGRREDHIERAAFELATNTTYAQKLNKLARVRKFPINNEKIAAAAGEMAKYMKAILVSYESGSEPTLPQEQRES